MKRALVFCRLTWATRFIAVLTAAGLAAACVKPVQEPSTAAGRFEGSLFVMWVGEGGASGDGTFLFVPDPKDPLTFVRANKAGPATVIVPGVMYTDGGSIPRIAQLFNGFSPWGYAPAYMVHDWLFVSRHCLRDGVNVPEFSPMKDVAFIESATILGEAIRGLIAARRVSRNDIAPDLITLAVGSEIARQLWDKTGACVDSFIKPIDLIAAEHAVPGTIARVSPNRIVGGTRPSIERERARNKRDRALIRDARVITRISF